MLLVNGINVYPREIEEIIYQFPGVKEAAVIGKPDARKGEQPMAFVAANEGAVIEENAVRQFVRANSLPITKCRAGSWSCLRCREMPRARF